MGLNSLGMSKGQEVEKRKMVRRYLGEYCVMWEREELIRKFAGKDNLNRPCLHYY